MGRSWTAEQLKAISQSGTNIIVSAGAGSGKTAVLTERVKQKLKQQVNINELLVLTFTNASAHEMKERIRQALMKEKELAHQLDRLDSAYITTFDSFALSIVKKYHYLLNIKPDIGIIENSIMSLKRNAYLTEILEGYYAQPTAEFTQLIQDFCLKDDADLKQAILDINQALDLRYDKASLITHYFEHYGTDFFYQAMLQQYNQLLQTKITEIEALANLISLSVDSSYMEKLEPLLGPLKEAQTYQEIRQATQAKLPPVPRGSSDEVKQQKARLTALLKELTQLTKEENEQILIDQLQKTQPYCQAILEIIQKLDKRVAQFKRTYDLYEFNDIAKLAIQVVQEHEDIRQELRDQFHEIMVDEYQDTSDLQEMFITMISNHNIYMVGDIKQSIYRFRNANPLIFKEKYDRYSKGEDGQKIDLNKNFRSRNTVLDSINQIFDYIMDDEFGGARYREEHRLIFGNQSYVEQGTTDQNMNLEIYNYQYEKESKFARNEMEAFIIAHDIQNKIDNHYQVFDKDAFALRDMRYSDVAILIDKTASFELYKQIFTYCNIPLELYKDEKLTNATIIGIIKNLLGLITAQTMDAKFLHCYTSIARSVLFSLPDEEIFQRVTTKNFQNDPVLTKVYSIRQELNHLSVKALLLKIIDDFAIYEKLILIGEIAENMARIDYLLQLTEQLSAMGYTIFDFATYLTELFEQQLDIKYSVGKSSQDSVKIMTIHKSKGLEFYICYFPEMYNTFNTRDLKKRFLFDHRYGMITPYYQEGIKKTMLNDLLKQVFLKEEISEKLRLFYVALTRAKEKIIILADLHQDSEYQLQNQVIHPMERFQYRSFQDILMSVKSFITPFIVEYNQEEISYTKAYRIPIQQNFQELEDASATSITYQLHEITPLVQIKEPYSTQKTELLGPTEQQMLETGKKLHAILESLDLANPNLEQLSIAPIYRLKIETFLKQPFLQDIKQAQIYQEYEFLFEDQLTYRRGIIDLMLEYPDKIKIIDYKFKNIDNPNYDKQLLGYRDYIGQIRNVPIELYLYSFMDETYRKVGDMDAITTGVDQ